MARDLGDFGDTIGSVLGQVARGATHAASHDHGSIMPGQSGNGALSGTRGVVAGAALAAAAPFAAKEAGKALRHVVVRRLGNPVETAKDAAKDAASSPLQRAADSVKGAVGGAVERKVDQVGGVPGVAKEAGKQMLTGGGGGGSKGGAPGVGKGRRMPVQQAVDVAVPLEVAYNQWTQFAEWPQFMHRVMQVTQEDDCTVSFKVKMWGMSKEFVAEIVEQRPDERIQWNTTEGVSHTGAVTFHALGPRLTRIQVSLDVDPGSLIEKAARGMRHVKRAVRADLARFKAFMELQEVESGAWRGVIHDGELVEQHDASYDRERAYAEVDDIQDAGSSHEAREAEEPDEDDADEPARGRAQPARGRAQPARARARAGRSGGSRTRSRSDGRHAGGGSARRSRGRRRAGAGGRSR